ncbi:preprotein translocase subunit YidC [Trypanosoma theileri]|uniref:Preprotein translocase subunit YidC n=1 Tax=Trypanosoma theileri TaxID=67003 RepID=A0A1X0P4X1_9TRYP|nr:preprotein translocase subunit YidC [Trypanosoma theileri]ORC91994.1 preprotein translocase subunit YidC [Trypanosoma theileri]
MRRLGRQFPHRMAFSRLPLLLSHRSVATDGWDGSSDGVNMNNNMSSAASNSSGSSYYDYLDHLWNRQWFGATEGLEPLPETSPFANLFVGCQEMLGLEPAIAILLFGAISRLSTLGFSLYGERASERMRRAMQRLKAPHEAFQRVYYREGSSALDIQLAATALKGERRRVFSEEKTSNLKCLTSLMGTPIVLFGLFQTTALCENPRLDIGTSSFLWCTAMTLPDPYGVIPTVFCLLTLMNFELSISKEMKIGWMSNIIWGARLGCLCVLPAMIHIRAGVALYFVGMSLIGLLQPLLLRMDVFRKRFDFPDQKLVKDKKSTTSDDELHTRMSVQFPYLAHLFNPESEENTELLKSASNVRRPISSCCNQREASAHVGGLHSIMREEIPRMGGRSHSSSTTTNTTTTSATASSSSSRKGADFAKSGWKTTQLEFSEEDFISELGGFDKGKGNERK